MTIRVQGERTPPEQIGCDVRIPIVSNQIGSTPKRSHVVGKRKRREEKRREEKRREERY